jgi:hypothetical protein
MFAKQRVQEDDRVPPLLSVYAVFKHNQTLAILLLLTRAFIQIQIIKINSMATPRRKRDIYLKYIFVN